MGSDRKVFQAAPFSDDSDTPEAGLSVSIPPRLHPSRTCSDLSETVHCSPLGFKSLGISHRVSEGVSDGLLGPHTAGSMVCRQYRTVMLRRACDWFEAPLSLSWNS